MICSLVRHVDPALYFNNVQLQFVEHHKHLGLTLSQDGTWHEHISNITVSASKVLGSMKMLKFKLNRNTLNQIYISYMRPIVEYAAIVWDSCTQYERDSIDKLQYEAARIVTGLTRSVSINKLVQEIGWVSLSDRRKIQKLVLIFKEKAGKLPTYLHELFPQLVGENNPYELRNRNNFITLARRTEIYSKSFIPSSLALWNELGDEIKHSPSLATFKAKLKQLFKPAIVPAYYLIGERTQSIYHARIRNQCSNLNSDLFINHLRESPLCHCTQDVENAEHFFLKCTSFNQQRQHMFTATRQHNPLSIDTILFGDESKEYEYNATLFIEVQRYIKLTRRFNNFNNN